MTTIRQFLGKKIFVNKLVFIDRWSYLHLVLFFLIGMFYPNRWALVIAVMIAFEILEAILSERTAFFKESRKDTISDLGFNVIGYWLGQNYVGAI